MKKTMLLRGIAAAGWMMVSGSLSAAPVLPHVSLKVAADNASDYKKIQDSSGKSREEKVQLTISLDNRDNTQIKDLSVEWTIYSRPVGKVTVAQAAHGTKKLSLDALTTRDFKSDRISITGTPRHGVTSVNKNRNNSGNNQNQITTTEVAASGNQYYGYAVQLYSGGILIDQAFSQSSLKKAN